MNDQVKKDRSWIILRKFAVLLSEYCHISRDVKFYADKLCITPDYLYKLTKKAMEMSPKEIIDQQIIIEIKTYLTNTDLSVKNIAAELHFDDSSYMCRFFHRLTGFPRQSIGTKLPAKHPLIQLPDILVNPIPYPDFFLLTNMCILRCISDSKKAGKLISVRSIDEMFHILRFITYRNTECTCQSFCRCCQQNILNGCPCRSEIVE